MTIEELFGSTAPKILSSAHHLLDFSLHTHLLPASPIKYGTYIFEYPTPIPPKTRGLRNNCPAVSRCEIQTLSHVQDSTNAKILHYLGHFYGWWENHNTIVKFGTAKGIQAE